IVSEKWIQMAKTPGPANKDYGFANWYLNTDRKPMPSLPASSVRFVGAGSNVIYIDWDNDLLVVVRWIKDDKSQNEFFGKVLAGWPSRVRKRWGGSFGPRRRGYEDFSFVNWRRAGRFRVRAAGWSRSPIGHRARPDLHAALDPVAQHGDP